MQIRCECGTFRADLTGLPRNTPGRLACYCDDCQTYLYALGRPELLDSAGGTEVIPVYPSEIKIISGHESLKCLRLSPQGLHRWSTTCCNMPIGNAKAGFPWMGIINRTFIVTDISYLEKTFGPIKSRILGRFARGTAPAGTSSKVKLSDMLVVLPFILKGLLRGSAKGSPFFKNDGKTPIVEPVVLALEERNRIRSSLGFQNL